MSQTAPTYLVPPSPVFDVRDGRSLASGWPGPLSISASADVDTGACIDEWIFLNSEGGMLTNLPTIGQIGNEDW